MLNAIPTSMMAFSEQTFFPIMISQKDLSVPVSHTACLSVWNGAILLSAYFLNTSSSFFFLKAQCARQVWNRQELETYKEVITVTQIRGNDDLDQTWWWRWKKPNRLQMYLRRYNWQDLVGWGKEWFQGGWEILCSGWGYEPSMVSKFKSTISRLYNLGKPFNLSVLHVFMCKVGY